jgi:bacterioferritin-associated ferredoxin
MYVCSCKAVSDRTVEATLAAGARCTEDVARMCGAGSKCGGCHPVIEAMLESELTLRARSGEASSAA